MAKIKTKIIPDFRPQEKIDVFDIVVNRLILQSIIAKLNRLEWITIPTTEIRGNK